MTINYAIAEPMDYAIFPPQSSLADLIASIVSELTANGWVFVTTFTAVYNTHTETGTRLLATSPQGYEVYLEVTTQTTGISSYPNAVGWQLKGVGTGSVSPLVYSQFDTLSSTQYQIVVCPCGWFFSRVGATADATCGGIPYDPLANISGSGAAGAACNLGYAVTTELWWIMGQSGDAGPSTINPRSSLGLNLGSTVPGFTFQSQNAGCRNGVVVTNGLCQVTQLSAVWNEGTLGFISQPIWYGGADLEYPAFIAWQDNPSGPLAIRGQIYNATCRTGQYVADLIKTWGGYQWVNYTSDYFFGSLWCATTPVSSGGLNNYAFV